MSSPRRCSPTRSRPLALPLTRPGRALAAVALALALLLGLSPAWTAAAGPTASRGIDGWSAWIASYLAAVFGGTDGLTPVIGATGVTRDPDGSPDPQPGAGTLRDPEGSPTLNRVFAGTGATRDPNGEPLPTSGTYRDPDGLPLPGSEDGGWIDPDG